MTDLIPTTALGLKSPETARIGGTELREITTLGIASLALRRDADQPIPFGLELPGPGSCARTDMISAVWTGPQQWMLLLEDRAEDDLVPDLLARAPGCSITEQTDAWAVFEVSAPDLTPFLERLVNLDLRNFGPGRATRTVIEHMGVYLVHREPGKIVIFGMRSSARSLWHTLTTVAGRLTTEP